MGPLAPLFRTSLLLLYLEVALLRWVGTHVPHASFFTHHVLLGALLGVSLGFFHAGRGDRLVRAAPWSLLATLAAGALFHGLHGRGLLAVRVDDPADPERLFFGTVLPNAAPRHLGLSIEVVLLTVFAGTACLGTALGQRLGQQFERARGRLSAYAVHLVGCVAGVLAFAALSAVGAPPLVWFAPALVLLGLEVHARWAGGAALVGCAAVVLALQSAPEGWERHWSPYGRVDHQPASGLVFVNGMGHQRIGAGDAADLAYELPFRALEAAGEPPPRRVLVLGAGTGNDVAVALASGAEHVDAVEIDPVLAALGRVHHPERPYGDPRVTLHVADGRAFLERADATWDLVVFGRVDSLTLHSSYGSVRLESYLFTREALAAARERLAPGGRVVISNYLRSGWLALRLAALCEDVFGAPPCVFTLPHRARIAVDGPPEEVLTVLVAGAPVPEAVPLGGEVLRASALGPSTGPLPTDDWPYPYLRARRVPAQNGRALAGLLAVGLLLALALRVPVARGLERPALFLGVGFALVETTSIARLAAVFGTTWQVHAAVVAGVMVTSLLGTALAARVLGRSRRVLRIALYASLAASLAASAAVDASALIALPTGVAPAALFLPLVFSGTLFGLELADRPDPRRTLGSNTLGVLLGITLEGLSVVTGLRGMVGVVAVAYALSMRRTRYGVRHRIALF